MASKHPPARFMHVCFAYANTPRPTTCTLPPILPAAANTPLQIQHRPCSPRRASGGRYFVAFADGNGISEAVGARVHREDSLDRGGTGESLGRLHPAGDGVVTWARGAWSMVSRRPRRLNGSGGGVVVSPYHASSWSPSSGRIRAHLLMHRCGRHGPATLISRRARGAAVSVGGLDPTLASWT